MGFVVERGRHTVDHVGLGVPDTEAGVAEVARLTGATPVLMPPEPGSWYHSGALPLGDGTALEIIGPNPAYRRFQPFAEVLRSLPQPTPMFWYVATGAFQQFSARARELGAPVERVEAVNQDDAPAHPRYVRGILGPGFISQRPCVIEWQRRADTWDRESQCALAGLRLSHPDADAINQAFAVLGIRERVERGPSSIAVALDTPRGRVSFDGPGLALTGSSAMLTMGRLWLRSRMRRLRSAA